MLTHRLILNYLLSGSVCFVLEFASLSSAVAAPAEQTAVFAGGCFWGIEAVFKHVKGVSEVVSGYAGGSASTAHYEQVSHGDTGHAEAVRVQYNPAQVSYQQLMQVFFSVAHNPTELNRQGPDVGSQYRSAIFYTSTEQQKMAESYILCTHCYASRAVGEILSSRGISPKLSDIASLPALYHVQRYAQVGSIA